MCEKTDTNIGEVTLSGGADCGTHFVQDWAVTVHSMIAGRLPMKMNYRFSPLSKDEREYLELILLEEMDIQSWFAITYCTLFGEEIFLSIQ
jgi:hypothetical protein